MNIFSFTAHFGSEEDCRLHFKEPLVGYLILRKHT